MALVNVLEEAGLPPGVLNLVNGDPAAMADVFLTSPDVHKLSFTGSQRVGQILMSKAAPGMKRLAMELGGSAPVLVFPDVDVEQAAAACVMAKFRNNGQVCISPSRFYVHHEVGEEFIEASRTLIEDYVIGDGQDPVVNIGPLVTQAARERVAGFVEPTLLMNLKDEMRVMREEIFGPVMLVRDFVSLDDALREANGTPYGLAAYLLTNDLSTAIRAYEGLDFGIIGVNDMVPATAEAPFGGVKQSGFGREGSQEGLEEYLETKFVSIAIE